jgi:DNA-binding MarR family transcriptional regulator
MPELTTPPTATRDAVLDEHAAFMRVIHLGAGAGQNNPWAGLDLTMQQFKLVWLLALREEGMHGRELAAVLQVGPSAITALVERIVEAGYAFREEDPHDRRITWVRLTQRGRELVDRVATGARERLGEILDQLAADELAVVLRSLQLLRSAAERLAARSAPGG